MRKLTQLVKVIIVLLWIAILASIIGYYYIQRIHELIGNNLWTLFVVEIFMTALVFSIIMYSRVKTVLIKNKLIGNNAINPEDNTIVAEPEPINSTDRVQPETVIKEHHRIIIKEVEDDSVNTETNPTATDVNAATNNEQVTSESINQEAPIPEAPKPAEKVYEMQAEPIPPSTVPIIFSDDLIAYVAEGWKKFFTNEQSKPYFNDLISFLVREYRSNTLTPMKEDLFKPFAWCDIDETKVVFLGVIPLSNNVADGLAFSTYRGLKPDITTTNLIKECVDDVNIADPSDNGCLIPWASRGVMLMNIYMTSPINNPLGHSSCGYQELTTSIIQELNNDMHPKVFVLWGNTAQKYGNFVTNPAHLVIKTQGPYSMSANNGFFGSKPFSQINKFLTDNKIEPIDWSI